MMRVFRPLVRLEFSGHSTESSSGMIWIKRRYAGGISSCWHKPKKERKIAASDFWPFVRDENSSSLLPNLWFLWLFVFFWWREDLPKLLRDLLGVANSVVVVNENLDYFGILLPPFASSLRGLLTSHSSSHTTFSIAMSITGGCWLLIYFSDSLSLFLLLNSCVHQFSQNERKKGEEERWGENDLKWKRRVQ